MSSCIASQGDGMAKAVPKGKAGTSRKVAEQRRHAFVEAFLANGGNATQAAVAAGFSPKTCYVTGAKMLKDPRIQLILSERTAKVFNDLEITTERILKERARLAFFDPRKLYDEKGNLIPLHKLDPDTAAVICGVDVSQIGGDEGISVTKKYKLADKNASLTSLERQLGMYRADNEQVKPDPIENIPLTEVARRLAFLLVAGAKG